MSKTLHLHLVSDATGETIISVARACMAQFGSVEFSEHFWNLVRTSTQLTFVFENIQQYRGVVLYTLVDEKLGQELQDFCARHNVPCISVLDPVINSLAAHLEIKGRGTPGSQHRLNAAYFSRVEAMEFTLAHDDGQGLETVHLADVILVGVSRSSKTPTALYLANRGIKAANIPLVPGAPIPEILTGLRRALVVGLTKDPAQLAEIRQKRLAHLNHDMSSRYAILEDIRSEIREARQIFRQNKWPVIDVTRRAIEETSAEILSLLYAHRRRLDENDTREE